MCIRDRPYASSSEVFRCRRSPQFLRVAYKNRWKTFRVKQINQNPADSLFLTVTYFPRKYGKAESWAASPQAAFITEELSEMCIRDRLITYREKEIEMEQKSLNLQQQALQTDYDLNRLRKSCLLYTSRCV